ncbi:hypothetical protein ABZ770_44105 [Streptomyces sp. NPDC006654]|uniref:hypothetical protein n=1 Tax=Streptomyces sp. NPDC006654 TaxID=3156897 RepID=UPI0033DDE6F8
MAAPRAARAAIRSLDHARFAPDYGIRLSHRRESAAARTQLRTAPDLFCRPRMPCRGATALARNSGPWM